MLYDWYQTRIWSMLAPACYVPLRYALKKLSASVCGIDAYLVEVEVDVGSADMNQFTVPLRSSLRRNCQALGS
jgi:hypothetical protein